jgi:hypothetical protein
MRGAVKAQRHSRHGAAARGSSGAEDFLSGSAGMVGKTGLRHETHASVEDREKAPRRKV